jgi:hypothetical protein
LYTKNKKNAPKKQKTRQKRQKTVDNFCKIAIKTPFQKWKTLWITQRKRATIRKKFRKTQGNSIKVTEIVHKQMFYPKKGESYPQ